MQVQMLKAKIHRATVTQAELDYVGSITIDIVDVNNGERFSTYTIAGEAGSGVICLNGAAARCVCTGDKVIIMCYCSMTSEEAKTHKPTVVFVDEANKPARIAHYEKHGRLDDQH